MPTFTETCPNFNGETRRDLHVHVGTSSLLLVYKLRNVVSIRTRPFCNFLGILPQPFRFVPERFETRANAISVSIGRTLDSNSFVLIPDDQLTLCRNHDTCHLFICIDIELPFQIITHDSSRLIMQGSRSLKF